MTRKLRVHELGRKSAEEFKSAEKWPVHLVLDQVRSLSNVGSFFRTADGFAVEKIWLCGATATPPHREIRKTALGAEETMEWEARPTTIEVVKDLKEQGFQILVLEQTTTSVDLRSFVPKPNIPMAIIFGHEVRGVDAALLPLADACIEIPQWGSKHSFNVSVAAGIVLWDLAVKTRK